MTVVCDATPRQAQASPKHPLGTRAHILLSSVFGPYAQNDEYGSRVLNPMELYHNQVTRVQGAFSLRMFHRSWGLMLMQVNIAAPCAVLDFPTLDRFREELRSRRYDIVGISSITSNWMKVRKMCQAVREQAPSATIVVGGHIANVPDLDRKIDADYIVRGDGVRWLREFLGQDPSEPVRHPLIKSGLSSRCLGIALRDRPGDVAATVIPSVGCPLGCNFCSTSVMFGGKGRFVNYYPRGDELFDVMRQLEQAMRVRSFFLMDENFLLHRPRALRLLELLEQHGKSWSLYVFSSANALRSYAMEELVRLGISWVWIGLEGESSQYAKLRGIDTRMLVRNLQAHGIRVLGSTIIGLEEHTTDNIGRAIEYAVAHATDFHQFMLYTPIPGTALYAQLAAQRRIKDEHEVHPGDVHGQSIFNYRHPHLAGGIEAELIVQAFQRDFEVNGPSIARIARTTLNGWRRYRRHPDSRIRDRVAWEARELATTYTAATAAARRHFRGQPLLAAQLKELLLHLRCAFGWKARLAELLGGWYVHRCLRHEEARLASGWTIEPPTCFEINEAMAELPRLASTMANVPRCQSVAAGFGASS
ncbi:MAG: cobalamin B12-binding domain-containing protein [Planctomycetes bacterium]|nr:cobalamin B12-binding domain-containing protein [Planctomycetota bacterium]